VSEYFLNPDRRLVIALAFSLLLHAAIFLLPGFSLPRTQSKVLTVRIEMAPRQPDTQGVPKPKAATVAQIPRRLKPKPATVPSATAQISVIKEAASSVVAAAAPASSSVVAAAPVTDEQRAPFPE
jgi:hypothetical protein